MTIAHFYGGPLDGTSREVDGDRIEVIFLEPVEESWPVEDVDPFGPAPIEHRYVRVPPSKLATRHAVFRHVAPCR